jgi:hypothetical protein
MVLSFRMMIIAVAVLGVGLGVAFGVGVAYGRGDPKTVESGLSQQQLQSLLGISGASAAGGAGTQGAGATGGAGSQGAAGQAGGASATLARNPTGRITAVEGQTITVETRTGPVKVNLTASTKINKLAAGAAADLTTNGTVTVTGTRRPDGSFDATEVSQVPAELQALLGGATAGSTAPGAGATPQPGNR